MAIVAKHLGGLTYELSDGRGHSVIADEPEERGGSDRGPKPTELLATSLASCVGITIQMYAKHKGFSAKGLEVVVEYSGDPDTGRAGLAVTLRVPPGLTDEQRRRIGVIAGKCPVHRVLVSGIDIEDRVEVLPE